MMYLLHLVFIQYFNDVKTYSRNNAYFGNRVGVLVEYDERDGSSLCFGEVAFFDVVDAFRYG